VLFTRDRWIEAYSEAPNDRLTAEYPLFTEAPHDVEHALPAYFASRLTQVPTRPRVCGTDREAVTRSEIASIRVVGQPTPSLRTL
jgi:hypothetical protein